MYIIGHGLGYGSADLFDVVFLHGEVFWEWLFFYKPRYAFENGTQKQCSLPVFGEVCEIASSKMILFWVEKLGYPMQLFWKG
jgi:hypothetical protein